MDTAVLHKLTYGLYILGAFKDGNPVGCVINTCFQVTSCNPLLVVSLNKNNYTLEAIIPRTSGSRPTPIQASGLPDSRRLLLHNKEERR